MLSVFYIRKMYCTIIVFECAAGNRDSEPNKRLPHEAGVFCLAGAEGFEPSTKVLETHVLPLHHAPKLTTVKIIRTGKENVKHFS